ncbi:MAG: Clp protease ClpP [Atopobium sp.]|nr:Clp protease ClpP [Atopobium sp.]
MENSFYLYSEINTPSPWDDETISASDLKEATKDLRQGDELNLYVNSPGGSVFEAVAMTAQLKRLRQTGVTVNAYIDGLAASAASFLIMTADNVYVYNTSMLMIHKPMGMCFGNAAEMLDTAEMLEQVENATMMPLYNRFSKVDEPTLKDMIAAETWMDADQICETFDFEKIDADKVVNNISSKLFGMYKHVPDRFKKIDNLKNPPIADSDADGNDQAEPTEKVDLDRYKRILQTV